MEISAPFTRVLGLAVLLWGAGCGARSFVPPLPTGHGGEMRVALPYEPRTLDPNSVQDEASLLLAPNLYSRLVALDADSRLFPDLAESWTIEDGGLRYVFRLRQGVRWHDGAPFTAADVRWTLDQLARRPGLADEAIRRISRIETPDGRTVEIRLREPWAPFLTTIASYGVYILPRHVPRQGPQVVGTGPFRLGSWLHGRHIILLPNRSFYRPGPLLDRVVYTFVGDPRRTAELLRAGALDYSVVRPPVQLIPQMEREPRLRVVTAPSDGRFFVGFNLRRPPLGDRRVREAINRAIDRQEILDRGLHGYGVPALGFYTPAVAWAYNGDAHVPPYDRDRARQLLREAGLRPDAGGTVLRLGLLIPHLGSFEPIGLLLRDQLRAVGIELRPVLLSPAEWTARTLTRHDFDLALLAGSQGPDPESLEARFGSHGSLQFMGYSNPALDAAVAEGARTVDLPRRARAYFRAQTILAHDLPIAPLAEGVRISVYRRGITGLPQAEARGLVPADEYSLVRARSLDGGEP
jgi:peptide/nickel transport system substrate-binding protein